MKQQPTQKKAPYGLCPICKVPYTRAAEVSEMNEAIAFSMGINPNTIICTRC